MEKRDAKAKMNVVFGRPGENAERSIGVIVKCNPTRAKVKLLEERGTRRQYQVGDIFNVPYALMEPAPEDGDKSKVEIIRHRPTVEIVPGQTTFRSVYADSNALWKVLRSKGRGVYLCEIVDEPIEIDGKMYPSDYSGTQKAFLEREIVGSIGMSNLFEGLNQKHENFYDALVPGQTIHYQNGFDNWVRCVVVKDGKENKLKPVALVGEWRSHDLPRRYSDGRVYNGHYADMVLKGELFTPNASNLFEAGCKPRNGVDPSTLSPISLALPEMTAEEKRIAGLWQQVHSIKSVIDGDDSERSKELDPAEILRKIKSMVK